MLDIDVLEGGAPVRRYVAPSVAVAGKVTDVTLSKKTFDTDDDTEYEKN
ncbi:hypothetical protein [Streptomyces hainanensis]|nr:hypothetical protein [Streptomyces hainanensis]